MYNLSKPLLTDFHSFGSLVVKSFRKFIIKSAMLFNFEDVKYMVALFHSILADTTLETL